MTTDHVSATTAEPGPVPSGLDAACAALAAGRPVVLPNATPMSYVVTATTPAVVNAAKGRPRDQNVGMAIYDEADWRQLAAVIDLPPDTLAWVLDLQRRELISFLVPLRARVASPSWIAAAVRDDYLGVFAPWWPPLAPLWQQFPRLFVSSANRTGASPAATAAQAAAAFGPDVVVVDGDALRAPSLTRGATTILRITPQGRLSIYRSGAHDADLAPEAFLERLAARRAR